MPEPGRLTNNWIHAYEAFTDELESPQLFHTWAAIATLTSAVRRNLLYVLPRHRLFLNCWILFVAPPGLCRKSEPIENVTNFLREIPSVMLSSNSLTRARFVEEMAQAMEASCVPIVIPGQNMPYIPEASATLSVVSTELGVFIGTADREFLSDLIDFFDCLDLWRRGLISRDITELRNTMLNLTGAVTPDAIVELLPDFAVGGGFTSRLMLVCANKKRRKISFTRLPQMNKSLKEDLSRDLVRISTLQGTLKLSDAAEEMFANWYEGTADDFSPGGEDRLKGYSARRQLYVLKAAGAHAIARSDGLVVDVQDMQFGMRVVLATEETMPIAFEGMGRSSLARDLNTLSRQIQLAGEIPYDRIVELNMKNLTVTQLEEAISVLTHSGRIKRVQRDSGTVLRWNRGKEDSPAGGEGLLREEVTVGSLPQGKDLQ